MSDDTSNFLIAEAQLVLDAARKEKAKRTKTLGDPIELPGKALAIEIQDGVAWIAENTTVVRKVDLETGKHLPAFKGHLGPVTTLAFCDRKPGTGDHEILISGSWDKSVKLWDTVTKRLISSTPNAHNDFVKILLVFPSLQLLVSGSSDKVVRFWDLSDLEKPTALRSVGSISSHTRPVECLDGRALTKDSAVLYTGDTMGVIKVWDLNRDSGLPPRWTATLKETINNHRTRINELMYGEGQLWTASADDTVQVIPDKDSETSSISTTKPPRSIAHPVAVRAILPLGLTDLAEPYLITGAGDILRVYDVSDLDEPEFIGEVDAHWHDITAIRLWMRKFVRADGRALVEPWIITTSLDRTIRKWKLSELLKPPPPKAPEVKAPDPKPVIDADSGMTEEEERELAELMGE
ncbi:WD40-repeat-containing domain protein [Crassisporium funariophilum]|nr:WD40-repeat-containing domain protein [Crassisporium funariophilum]